MLLNEFLKEHRKVQELKGMVAQQHKQIEALTATVQKVSDQLELTKAALQLPTVSSTFSNGIVTSRLVVGLVAR